MVFSEVPKSVPKAPLLSLSLTQWPARSLVPRDFGCSPYHTSVAQSQGAYRKLENALEISAQFVESIVTSEKVLAAIVENERFQMEL